MNPNEYQKLAERTECNQNVSAMRFGENGLKAIRLNHAVIGINAEGGELATALQRWLYYGKPLDETNIKEELGDLFWYIAEACNALGFSMETIMEANIAKLRQRYPEKFSEVLAAEENRDRAAEARAIESTEVPPTTCTCGETVQLSPVAVDNVNRAVATPVLPLYERFKALDDGVFPKQEEQELRATEMEQCPSCRGPLSDEMLKDLRKGKRTHGQCPNCMKKFVLGDNGLVPTNS